MSTILDATLVMADTVPAEPNWMIVVVIAAIFLGLVIFLILPRKKKLGDDSTEKQLTDDKKKASSDADVRPENYEEKKENLSLAEIKAAKRQTADDMSKEELRELRKERRAATQTEKAMREHEDDKASPESSANKDVDEASGSVTSAVIGDETSSQEGTAKEAAASAQDTKPESDITIDDENVVIKSDVDTKDVFASLFGDAPSSFEDPFASFNDPFSDASASESEADGPVFQQTLGSQLISLDALTKAAAEADAKSGEGSWEELTKRLVEKSEKKTLS